MLRAAWTLLESSGRMGLSYRQTKRPWEFPLDVTGESSKDTLEVYI